MPHVNHFTNNLIRPTAVIVNNQIYSNFSKMLTEHVVLSITKSKWGKVRKRNFRI